MYVCGDYITSNEDEYTDSDDDTFIVPIVLTLGTVDHFHEVKTV